MIFATVGTQLPFPRLISALDDIAGRHGLDLLAQTGGFRGSALNIRCRDHLSPSEYHAYTCDATLLVGHAGIGTVLTAKKLAKPVVIYPRQAALGEHRNDHQVATAKALEGTEGVYIAWDDLMLERLLTEGPLAPASLGRSERRDILISRLRDFIG